MRHYLEYVTGKKKSCQFFRTIMEKLPMELAFLYKQLALNGPEINRLEAGMASSAFTLTSWNYCCPLSKRLKALGEFLSLLPSPKALMLLNVNVSQKGPQPCWTRKRESKQTLICRTRGTDCSLVWTWVQLSQAPRGYCLAGGHRAALCAGPAPWKTSFTPHGWAISSQVATHQWQTQLQTRLMGLPGRLTLP